MVSRGERIVAGIIIIIGGLIASGVLKLSAIITDIVLAVGVAVALSSFFILVNQYERGIVLRLGKYNRTVEAGLQTVIPFYEGVDVLDIRESVQEFEAERMLTKDNVPVTIDAILRYKVVASDAKSAILNVEDFEEMISQISQTALRNNIGSADFQDLLSKREDINAHIKTVLAKEAKEWGIEVTGVEIRAVTIPDTLEKAMSAEAQAEREKNARKKYGESEIMVAKQFEEASKVYENNPVAYALRQSNMLYESMKVQGNTVVLVPSESLNSMGYGNLGMTLAYLENTKKAASKSAAAPPAPAAAPVASDNADKDEDDEEP